MTASHSVSRDSSERRTGADPRTGTDRRSATDWTAWHGPYSDPVSELSQRLRVVQSLIAEAMPDEIRAPYRVVSMCAGQGHDILAALECRPDARHVQARLVEADTANAAAARTRAEQAGLTGVEVVVADAARVAVYAGLVPAELVLVCGVFGNVTDDDVMATIDALPQLCAPGGTVVWTRHRKPPDLTPAIRARLTERGFVETAFVAPEEAVYGVGAARFEGEPKPLEPERRLFTFVR